jgi:hypothetical protein
MTNKPKRGGARKGAGRKPTGKQAKYVNVNFKLASGELADFKKICLRECRTQVEQFRKWIQRHRKKN